jgi:hypothetical protein
MPQNEPGISFRFNGLCIEDALTHQDLAWAREAQGKDGIQKKGAQIAERTHYVL